MISYEQISKTLLDAIGDDNEIVSAWVLGETWVFIVDDGGGEFDLPVYMMNEGDILPTVHSMTDGDKKLFSVINDGVKVA